MEFDNDYSQLVQKYVYFEHKFFATLKPLLLKPGELTKQYVAGKRVKFILILQGLHCCSYRTLCATYDPNQKIG